MNKTIPSRKKHSVLPAPTIRRFPLYLSFLKSLKGKENVYVSAPDIAKTLRIDSTQITKDFSFIKVAGKTKVGYEINKLVQNIEKFLGYRDPKKAFIIGIGNLGTALIKYNQFSQEGLEIIAGFDIDTEKVGTRVISTKIYHIKNFKKRFNETPVEIGIITTPSEQAQIIADTIIECGIKAIWNFSASPISAPGTVIVENTSIDSGLAMIKWKLNAGRPLIYK
ncbi:MAG: redox-sensing transcriptional repressor Rex [Cytophagales bacterium]|nr:redox-sensing transcriptional repressor Rex [Cytophagales bacterium]